MSLSMLFSVKMFYFSTVVIYTSFYHLQQGDFDIIGGTSALTEAEVIKVHCPLL